MSCINNRTLLTSLRKSFVKKGIKEKNKNKLKTEEKQVHKQLLMKCECIKVDKKQDN